ncbi:uncharacterized protein LOC123499741 isoform X2 [Portunus trituberculatus]|uniref:uncharacterized protein LOC123499741 isoform X2 n=1 Tax=Portunus trituberculatus TaxID=210409 RepID=UPI001E1D1F64|nr:uncharacterized protein LOC123499741 isoform X2 [Portunus trituberculatus]
MPPVHLTMIGPRLSLLITVTLLLTPLCLTDLPHTRHQIPNGRSVSDEEVAITSTIYEEGDGGEGNGANGDGHEQDGILRATARAIWGTLRPYVVAEGIDSFERLVSLKSRLLKEVEDEVTAYTNVTVFTWPDDDFGPEHQTEEVKAATSAGAGENDDSYYSGNDMMRTKREHPVHHPFIRDPFGVAMLDEVDTLLSLETEPTLGVYMTQWHGRLIVAGMGVRKIVTLYAVTQRPYKVESTPPFPGVHSCRFTVVPEDILLVACISPVRRKVQHLGIHEELVPEVTVYQVEEEAYGSGKLSTKHLQSIEVDEPVDLEMWSRDGEHYLLIANSKEVNVEYSPSGEVLAHRTNYHSVSYLYKWKEHYFDALQHRVLPGSYPRTVTHFTIGSRHFVAMANYRNNKGQRNIDSFIFHYSLEEDHLVLFQQLPTRGALHIASFTLGHSHFADTFLAVANSCEDEDGGSCNPHTNSAIYQFTGKKFVLFQEVPTLLAVQWLAVQVEGTVLLAVAQMVAGVKLFQYDGWRFVATKIQHYEGSFGPGATGLAAAHWNGTVVLAVSSLEHQDSLFHSLDVFRLTFRKNTRLKAVHSDYEAWCVAALREAKQTELVASLVSGIQAATNQTYVFTSHVTIKGSLTAGLGSFVTQTFERTTSRHLPVLTGGITQLLLTLGSKVQQAVVRISNAVSLSDPISWPGDLHLYDLSAGSASAERLYVHDVNQRVVSWRDAVMLEGIDLQYMARLRLDHVEIKAVTQIANLKGQPFSSFVTLSGHHTIFGHVSFSAAIRVASLIAVTVDKVVITPQYVLIADDSQYLNGSLTCQYLNAVSLEVVTINGVPLSPLLSSLVLKDARSAVNGLVRVMGNLAYHGNLQVNLSLPLDLKNVIKVDYAGLQVVTGGHQVGELAAPSMAIEGRLNNMRVPAEVFLNGSHHSYIVVSAAFSHVRAISVFIFQKLHNLTVTEGRLDVLLLSGYQIVTAPKTFTSLQLLEQNAPNYRSASIRRRRWSSENCELPRNRRPKTLTARIETLFLVLRGVAAAQDLLIFLTEIQPGQFLVPGQNLNFFNLLMQNVDCAILYLENNGNLKLHETLDAIKWHNTTVFIQNELPTDNMTEMIGNIQSYLVQEKLELKKVTLNADDLLLINNLKKVDSTRRDLLILDYLIDITSNHELENLPSEIFHRNCLLFCPAFHENIRDRKKMQMSCIPEILTVFKAMKTISKYSAIITEMKQLSAHSYQILKAGVVRYLLGQLLRSVSEKKELRKQVYAAVVCRLSPEGSEEYQQMLITYRRELHQNTSRFIHSRIKRQASEAAYGLTDPEPPSTLPASNSEDTSTIPLSFNEDANENSSTLQDSVIENTSQDSSTLSASTTEATSEDSPTLSVSARKNIAAIPEDTSQDSSAFTVSIIDNNSEDSSALPLSVTEDTSEDSSTLQASVTEDTNEDSSTLPTSITEDTIEDSSTLPASVTDETSGDSSILPASITDETSGDSSIFPASITEDTSGDSSTPPASITEDTSGDPSIFPASITEDTSGDSFTLPVSVTEDTSGDSSTFTAYVTEDTSGDSSILPASVTEDTSGDSSTLSASVTEDTRGDSSILPASVTEDTSGDSSTLPASVTEDTSGDSSILPASVTEDTSGDSSTLPASVTEDTSGDSSILPASVTEGTSGDSSILPASVTEDTSGDSSTLPASVTEDTSGDSSTLPASVTEDTSGDSSILPASVTEGTSGDSSTFTAYVTEDTSGDSSILPASVTEGTSGDSSTFTAYVTEDTSGDSSILPASVTEDTSGDSSTLPAYVTEDTSGDSSNLLHSVIDNTSEGSSTLLASFIEDTSGDSSTLPPSVIDSTNEGSSTLPTSVTEDTSGDSSTIPSSVIDSTSEGYSTLPASVTEDTSGDSSTLPASITENTSEDSSTLPASITEDTSEDSSTLPASITEDTSGDSSTLPASITEDSSENSSVTPYRREDANEDSSTHTLSIGEINTAFAAATTEFFSSSLDSSTFTGSTNEISFNFSTLAPLSVSPSSMYGDSVFLSARAGLLSELRELETTVAVDSDKTTQILGFQTTDEKTTPEDHVTDSILRLSTTGNAQITGIFADILGLRTTEGTSESMDSVTVDLKGTIDLTAISGSQTVGITGNEIADPETIPEAEKPNFTTDITKTSTTTVTDVTEDSSPNTMTEKATESSVVTDKDITNPFTIVNNNMEVNLSQTDADAILVPLKVSLNYENCSTLPPNLLQDSNRLMYLYRRMQMTDDYFSTVVRLLPELKVPKEPSQYDVGVEGAMLDAFGFLIDTVKKFVLDPIGFLGELDIERLQKDLDFFFFVSSFATSSQYYYWSERLRYRDLYLKTLLEFSGIITRRLLNCFETFYPEFSTSGYETTSHPFAYSDDMPEIVKNMSEEFKTNSALIKNLMILLNFTKNVVALNPYLNKRCPAPHAIDPEGVAIAIEEVRETLGFILEDELMFSKVVNTSFLENQVLILKDNTQMCLMASHLPQEVEASLSQIYEENGSVLAEDAQKLLNIRIKHLQRINLALVDTIVDIADHRAIDSELSPPEPISAIPDSQTQWNWDGLWLDGRLAGYLLSQLFDEAGLLLSASPHKEYTANFYPAPLSHVNFIEAHKDKVRHLRFLSGLSAPTVQGMGMAQIQRHGLALTATTNIVLTFVASVTVDGPVTVSRVNGIHASSFITLGGHHTLQQPFIFMGSITAAARVRVHNEINGLDLVLLSNSVVLTSSVTRQVLRQPIIFTQVSAQRVVFETGRVQEVDLDDLVTLGHPAIITGRKTFQELIVRENGTVAGAVDARYVGGINVTDLFYNSLIKNPGGLQVVAGRLHLRHLVVLNDVTTHGIVCLDWHGVPGVLDLNSIASRVVLLNGSASITADLVITGSVYVTGLFFRDTLDGVSVALYRDGWILRDTDQSIHGNVSFDNIISHSVIISQGIKVQDVDVTRLYLKTFLTTWPSTLPLPLTFRGHVNAARVEVRGLVQGWDLSKHALLQHSSSTVFTAAKVFLGDVLIAGNLTSTNPGDDCTYFPFLNLTVIGTVVVENIFPTASVFLPDHEITTKTATQYWLADTDTKVSIEIFFDVIVLSHLNAIVTWNNLEMKDFSKSLFEKRCDVVQALAGFYSFSDLEIEESLYTPAINSSSLNGVVSSNLRHVLMADGAQVFTGHPSINNLRAHGSGTVVTSEGVNGLLMSHMCRHAEPCIVHAPKTLVQDFEIMEDLTLPKNSLVQGVDVSRSLHAWVSRNLCGFIPGLTTFTGPFIVDNADYNIRVRGLVDGVKVTTSHVMTLIGTQSMSGKLVIHQGISVVSHEITTLDGLFNGHNLTDARQRAFLLGDPALPVVVRAPVIFKDLVVFRDAARLNPSDPTPVPIFRDFKSFFFDFSLLHNLSVRSQRAMQGRVRQYWGWRVVQEFDSNHERLIPLSLEGISGPVSTTLLPQHHHLALVSSQGNVPVLQREPDVDRYTGSDVTLASRCTTGLVSYISEGRTFIVTSHACLEHITAPVYYAASVHATISESVGTDDDLHVWEVTPQGALLRGAFSVPGALDIQVVWLEQASSTCLVVVEARGTDVLVVCERQAGMFVEHQRLNFTRPSKVSVVQHTPPVGRKHLALAVADPGRTALKGGGIYFFHYDVKSGEFLLIQEELLEDVVWVEFVSRGPDLLLAAVTEDRLGVREGHVCLYKVDWYNPDGLTPLGHRGPLVKSEIPSPRVSGLQHTPQLFAVQELELEDPSEARFLITPSGGLHLYVVGHSGLITWFSQEGIHRFRKEGEVRVANGMTLEVWAMKGKEWTPRISVAGGRCPRGSHQAPNQPTFVLEMIFRGSRNIPAQ